MSNARILNYVSSLQRLDIRGRVKVLHGQNRKSEEPPLALFAICTPFGPPSLLEIPQKEVMFKSKHKLDLALVSMDQRLILSYCFLERSIFIFLNLSVNIRFDILKLQETNLFLFNLQIKNLINWQYLKNIVASAVIYKMVFYFEVSVFLSTLFSNSRGKMLLGYSDAELANMGGYDLVHYDDLAYVASAHQECKYLN